MWFYPSIREETWGESHLAVTCGIVTVSLSFVVFLVMVPQATARWKGLFSFLKWRIVIELRKLVVIVNCSVFQFQRLMDLKKNLAFLQVKIVSSGILISGKSKHLLSGRHFVVTQLFSLLCDAPGTTCWLHMGQTQFGLIFFLNDQNPGTPEITSDWNQCCVNESVVNVFESYEGRSR